MTSRVRQSTATPAPRRSGVAELPPYQAPEFPLNPTAQRALAQLKFSHKLDALDHKLKTAQQTLNGAAATLNDRLTQREAPLKRRRANANGDTDAVDTNEIGERLANFRTKVENMTRRMDDGMRKLVDSRQTVHHLQQSLDATTDDARANASTQASTQDLRPRRHGRRSSASENDGDHASQAGSDEEYPEFQPTDPATLPPVTASVDFFRKAVQDKKIAYQSYSLTARYAENDEYRDFRRVVNDAQHPDGDVSLPPPSEWFIEGGAPAPGVTARRGASQEDDSDDDVAVSRVTISTKCPLTLQEFKNPLTSTKCPHSFESAAILEMIRNSNNRLQPGQRSSERAVQCPVPGCSSLLSKNDLRVDALLIRKIHRIQRAREMEEEESGNEDDGSAPGTQRRAVHLTSSDDEDGTEHDNVSQMKSEPRPTLDSRPPRSTAQSGRGTQVTDLDVSSDEDG